MATKVQYDPMLREMADRISKMYPNEPADAGEAMLAEIKSSAEYDNFVEALLQDAVMGHIYEARHRVNVAIKRERGHYTTGAKQNRAGDRAVSKVATSVYEYHIGGRTLGGIYGRELESLANNAGRAAEGLMFNQRLCLALAQRVPADKTVKESLSAKKLEEIFSSCYDTES